MEIFKDRFVYGDGKYGVDKDIQEERKNLLLLGDTVFLLFNANSDDGYIFGNDIV